MLKAIFIFQSLFILSSLHILFLYGKQETSGNYCLSANITMKMAGSQIKGIPMSGLAVP